MPKISRPIPEVFESITHPVGVEMSRRVIAMTGLPKETQTLFTGVGDLPVPQTGSTIDYPGAAPRFPSSTLFKVQIAEEYSDDAPFRQARMLDEHEPIFYDEPLGIVIRPIYQITKVNISVEARFRDLTSAIRWRDDIRVLASAGRAEMLHEIHYSYPVPLEYLVILRRLHELREAQAGYGDTLGDYLRSCFDERYTVAVNQAGKRHTILMREHQIGVMGWFDFEDQPPRPDKEHDTGTYGVSFDYTYVYDKCVAAFMQYPLMIHNQLVPHEVRDRTRPYDLDIRPQRASWSRSLIYEYGKRYPGPHEGAIGLSIPFWDDWLPRHTPVGTSDLIRLMLELASEAEPNIDFTLKDLGHHEFDSDAMAYMEEYPGSLLVHGESVFNFQLYENYIPMNRDCVTIDEDLRITNVEALDIRKMYHGRVSLLHGVERLTGGARERLRRHGAFAQKLFVILNPRLADNGLLPDVKIDGSMERSAFDRALEEIQSRSYYMHATPVYRQMTINNIVISTDRSE